MCVEVFDQSKRCILFLVHVWGENRLKLQCEAIARALAQRQGSTWQNRERKPISAAVNDQAET